MGSRGNEMQWGGGCRGGEEDRDGGIGETSARINRPIVYAKTSPKLGI